MSINPSDIPKPFRQRWYVKWIIGGKEKQTLSELFATRDEYLSSEIQALRAKKGSFTRQSDPVYKIVKKEINGEIKDVEDFESGPLKKRFGKGLREQNIHYEIEGETKTIGRFKGFFLNLLRKNPRVGDFAAKFLENVKEFPLVKWMPTAAAKSNMLWGLMLSPIFAAMDTVQGYKETQGNLLQKLTGGVAAGLKSCVAQLGGNAVFALLPIALECIGITGGPLGFGLSIAGSIVVQNFLTKKLKIHPDKKKAGAESQNQTTLNPFAQQGMQAPWGANYGYQGMVSAQQSATPYMIPGLSPAQVSQPYSGGGGFSGSSSQQSSASDKALAWAINPNSVQDEIANLRKSNGKNAFL